MSLEQETLNIMVVKINGFTVSGSCDRDSEDDPIHVRRGQGSVGCTLD